MDVTVVAVGAGVVGMIVVLVVLSVRHERRRMADIREWAARHGWTVDTRPSAPWVGRLPGHHRRHLSLLVSGTVHGWHVGVGEYSYVTESTTRTGSGSSSTSTTTHRLVVTAVQLPRHHPPLAVETRGALGRLGRSLFGDNPAATGHDAFDRRFRVRTKHPELARTMLGPALIGEHLAGRVPAWSIADQHLLTWQPGTIKDPGRIAATAESLTRVAAFLGR